MIKKASFIKMNYTPIELSYQTLDSFGKGSYGEVYRVMNIQSQKFYACKKIKLESFQNLEQIETELNILTQADHPNIIRLHEIFRNTDTIYFILEECLGGDLHSRFISILKDGKRLTEAHIKKILKPILEALSYLHNHKICHRDIKPNNIMFTSTSEDSPVKLIDFGLSKVFRNTFENASIAGTLLYTAPEVFTSCYNEKCDIWSLGVVIYILLTGQSPFYSKEKNELIQLIMKGSYSLEGPLWKGISEDAKDLISSMLTDVNSRLSASEALAHPWFKKDYRRCSIKIDHAYKKLTQFSSLDTFQKSVIYYISLNLPSEDTEKLSKIFIDMDTDKDGHLTYDEIAAGLRKLCKSSSSPSSSEVTVDQLSKIINQMDLDKNNIVDYSEFIASLNEDKKHNKRDLLQCFSTYDKDNDGAISLEEFCSVIVPESEEEQKSLSILFDLIDRNRDHFIDSDEFILGMQTLLIRILPTKPKLRNAIKNFVGVIIEGELAKEDSQRTLSDPPSHDQSFESKEEEEDSEMTEFDLNDKSFEKKEIKTDNPHQNDSHTTAYKSSKQKSNNTPEYNETSNTEPDTY